jgi:hypothetical protein
MPQARISTIYIHLEPGVEPSAMKVSKDGRLGLTVDGSTTEQICLFFRHIDDAERWLDSARESLMIANGRTFGEIG